MFRKILIKIFNENFNYLHLFFKNNKNKKTKKPILKMKDIFVLIVWLKNLLVTEAWQIDANQFKTS